MDWLLYDNGLRHEMVKLQDLLNIIPLIRTKMLVNNLLMSKF